MSSSLLKVFDEDGKLVHLQDTSESATSEPLTLFETEVLRIFKEYQQLKSPWIPITKETMPEKQEVYWVTDGHTTSTEMFLLKPMKPSFDNKLVKPSFSDWATHYQPITLPEEN